MHGGEFRRLQRGNLSRRYAMDWKFIVSWAVAGILGYLCSVPLAVSLGYVDRKKYGLLFSLIVLSLIGGPISTLVGVVFAIIILTLI